MQKKTYVVLSVVACIASLAHGRRTLLADQTVASCTWYGDTCAVNPSIALTATAPDVKAKLAQKVAATYYVCAQHTTNATCVVDTTHQCSWIAQLNMCIYNPDLTDYQTLLACPGSKYSSFVSNAATCAPLGQADCSKNAACKWTSASDLAGSIGDFFNSILGSMQSKSVLDGVGACTPASMITANTTAGYDKSIWGSCEGVQLLEAFAAAPVTCAAITQQTDCKAKAYCTWGTACTLISNSHLANMEVLLTGSTGDFNTTMGGYITACSAATTEGACTTATKSVKFDDAIVATALEFKEPNNAGLLRPGVPFLMAAVAGWLLLLLA